MTRHYLRHTKSDKTTADMGWHMQEGGRSCPPPSPNEHVIDDVPYRNGEYDVGRELGLEPTYPMRELSYTLFKRAGSADDLVSWLASCRNAELYDSFGGCTFQNATFASMELDTDARDVQVATVTFKADPFKKGGSL